MSRKNNSAKVSQAKDRTSIYVAFIGLVGTVVIALVSLLNTRTQVLLPVSLTQTASVPITQTPKSSDDDFTSDTLDSKWTWIDPLGDSRNSLTVSPGRFRIITSGASHSFWGQNFNSPRLMQTINDDFVIKTKVYATPKVFYQGAGLLIHLDNTKWVKLQLGNLYGTSEVYLFYKNQTVETLEYSIPMQTDSVFLRLDKCGGQVTSYLSTDNINWQEIGSVTFPANEIVKTGISVENDNNAGEFFAEFDFFRCV